jgi:uncharacterized membrane protein
MILGRQPALWLALVAALLNVMVVVFGIHLTGEQIATLNAFAIAVVGIVANESDPTTAGTFAPTITRPAPTPPIMAGVPVLSSGGAAVPTAGGTNP